MMWLVFDQLWSVSAAVQMKRTFASNLRLLAQFAREPISRDLRTAGERSYALRETINGNFDRVRDLSGGVLLEFGLPASGISHCGSESFAGKRKCACSS